MDRSSWPFQLVARLYSNENVAPKVVAELKRMGRGCAGFTGGWYVSAAVADPEGSDGGRRRRADLGSPWGVTRLEPTHRS